MFASCKQWIIRHTKRLIRRGGEREREHKEDPIKESAPFYCLNKPNPIYFNIKLVYKNIGRDIWALCLRYACIHYFLLAHNFFVIVGYLFAQLLKPYRSRNTKLYSIFRRVLLYLHERLEARFRKELSNIFLGLLFNVVSSKVLLRYKT